LEVKSDSHGLASRFLLEFFEQVERLKLDVNSFMLLQDGEVVAQFWRKPYRRECPQLLYSLSKSFTSIAVGIAWDNGYLDLNDPVISFFPERVPERISTNLEKMTVHHLLSMNAGHHDNIYSQVIGEEDWVKAFLSLEVEHEPGSYYRYSTPSTYMLSAILERVTGQNLVDFLMPRLFGPLGIPRPIWETCPMGVTAGGMGLSLPTESIAAFGQMLLGKGVYKGKRIVSESYIELATTEQSDNRPSSKNRIDSAQGYGYQFHLCRRGCYRGDGAFGQLCFVAPKEQIVIAATSSFQSMQPLQTLLDLIYAHIIDPAGGEELWHPDDHIELQRRLSRWTYPVPVCKPVPAHIPEANNRSYRMSANPHGLCHIAFQEEAGLLGVRFIFEDGRDEALSFDYTKPMHDKSVFTKDLAMHLQEVVTYACWHNNHTLQLTLLYIETPYVVTYTIVFQERTIDLQFSMNVSLNLPDYRASGHCS